MKTKSILVLVLCLLMSLSLCACTENEGETPASQPVNLTVVLADINSKFGFSEDTMRTIEDTDSLDLYYSISPADVKQFAAETTKDTANDITEIILVEAVDADAAKRVADALETRRQSQRDLCNSYSPELVAIIDECPVDTDGNYVSLIISDKGQEITDCYKSAFLID